MYTSAHVLYIHMLLCWHPHSYLEVCEAEEHVYETVAIVCSGNAWVGQVELRETLGDNTVQYRYMQRMFCALLTIAEQCVEEGRHCTVYKLADCTGIYGSAVL
jgi:hypothetical protein